MAAANPSFGARPAPKGVMAFGVGITFFLHIGMALTLVFLTKQGDENLAEEIAPKMLEFEQVELLALGEDKPEDDLPRIPNPEEAVKPPDEVNLAEPDEAVIDLKKEEEEEKEDPDAKKRKMLEALSALHNPNRPTNEDTPQGSEEGTIGGTALKSLVGNYATKLVKEITKYWELPSTLSLDEAKQLAGSVKVYIRLSETGSIVTFKFKKESENVQFNESIERALKKFQASGGGRTLPVPDQEEVKQAVISQGINLRNWEYTGR